MRLIEIITLMADFARRMKIMSRLSHFPAEDWSGYYINIATSLSQIVLFR